MKSSIRDVWNRNYWTLFGLEIELGGIAPWLRPPCTCTCHIINLSKLQIYVFHYCKAWEKANFCKFFEKVKASKRKLKIDDPELPEKEKF